MGGGSQSKHKEVSPKHYDATQNMNLPINTTYETGGSKSKHSSTLFPSTSASARLRDFENSKQRLLEKNNRFNPDDVQTGPPPPKQYVTGNLRRRLPALSPIPANPHSGMTFWLILMALAFMIWWFVARRFQSVHKPRRPRCSMFYLEAIMYTRAALTGKL